jgi:WD40 repeat protein
VSSDGKLIAAVGDSRNVMVWRSESGSIARKIQLPVRSLSSVFIGTEELAIGSSDGKIRLIDLATGRIEREISAGPEVFALAVSPDRRLLASGLPLGVWEISTAKRIATPRGFAQGDVAFSPDGKWLASGEYTGGGRLFTMPSTDLVSRLATNEEKRVQGPKGASVLSVAMPVTAVTFSPDGGLLATAGGDRRIQLWRISGAGATEKPEAVLDGHSMSVTGVSFSPNNTLIASASLDHTVRLWQVPRR